MADAEASSLVQSSSRAEEVRAMWVVRTALVSPQSVSRVVELAAENGFNTLIVQVRGRGDAYYLGGLEPRAEVLEEQPPDFDPLAQILAEAHRAGIAVHAWLNTFFCWSGDKPPKAPNHVVNAHPEWLLRDADGKVVIQPGDEVEGAYLDPAHPNARRFVHDVFLDVASRYDADGVHFDFVRYPSADIGYSDYDLSAFRAFVLPKLPPDQVNSLNNSPDPLIYPKTFPGEWSNWKRNNVTALVRSVYEDVKRLKPRLVVSAATIAWGTYAGFENSNAYTRVGQDWFGWLRDGILDAACPMAYHQDTERFSGWIEAAVRNSCGRAIWAGIGSYLISPESTAEKINAARRLGADGFCIFSYNAVTEEGASDQYLKAVARLAGLKP